MSKILSSKYKASRRLGISIWGSSKDAFNKRNYLPGDNRKGKGPAKGLSDYGAHLTSKQRIKSHYAFLKENQIKNFFVKAKRTKEDTPTAFIKYLESMLYVVVYRLNFAPTIFAAKQLVIHGHVSLNNRKISLPKILLKEGDVLSLREKIRNNVVVTDSISKKERGIPDYLQLNEKDFEGIFLRAPIPSEVPCQFLESDLPNLVEFYSKKT